MTNSAPSKEPIESLTSSGDQSHTAGGQDAGRSCSHEHKTWLARTFPYWFAVVLSVTLPVIAFAAAYLKMDLLWSAGVSAFVGFAAFIIMITTSRYYSKMIEAQESEAAYLKALRELEEEHNHLQHKFSVLYAFTILKRGRLALVKQPDDAAAGRSRSENQEDSAAVVNFPTDGDAA